MCSSLQSWHFLPFYNFSAFLYLYLFLIAHLRLTMHALYVFLCKSARDWSDTTSSHTVSCPSSCDSSIVMSVHTLLVASSCLSIPPFIMTMTGKVMQSWCMLDMRAQVQKTKSSSPLVIPLAVFMYFLVGPIISFCIFDMCLVLYHHVFF